MKRITQIFILITGLIFVNFLSYDPEKPLVERKPVPASGRKKIIYENNIRVYRPSVVLLGNSMLGHGVDERLFSQLSGTRTMSVWSLGGQSAWWYLVLKNVITEAPVKPKVVAVFFRDTDLTEPSYRVADKFRFNIDDMAGAHEPLLDRLAYLNNLNIPQYTLFKYCPAYRSREDTKRKLEMFVKDVFVSDLLGLKTGQVDETIERVFADEKMNQELLTQYQLSTEAKKEKAIFNFSQQLEKSFLPYIIRQAKDNSIKLIFVRFKKRRDIHPGQEPAELVQYIKELNEYLAGRGVTLLDFTHDPRINIEFYAEGDHLSLSGSRLFTEILVQSMKPVIEGQN